MRFFIVVIFILVAHVGHTQYSSPTLRTAASGGAVVNELEVDIAWWFGEAAMQSFDFNRLSRREKVNQNNSFESAV